MTKFQLLRISDMTTSIKADKESNVGTLTDIRLKLQESEALKLSLSVQKGSSIRR